jgi:hypothetical protein
MDTPVALKPVRIKRWLPYWAVLQADVHLTLHSWVYRTWVLVSVAAAVGYLLYHVGVYQRAGIIQFASAWVSDLLRWTLLGSTTLIVVLTAGTISSERGTLADSVLSRGISRYQYFLGKLHARLVSVLGTFLVMGGLMIAAGFVFLHEDLSLWGSLVALATATAVLGGVVTCGVTVSALANTTVVGIAVLWFLLYGGGFVLALLPEHFPFLERSLNNLPNVLRGYYDLQTQLRLMGWSAIVSCGVALVGLVYFARRDV